jgi:hypothetical protein
VASDIALGDCLDMEDVFHHGGFHVRPCGQWSVFSLMYFTEHGG